MPIHYDIESDVLYKEGIEKGIEKGVEIGIEKGVEKGALLVQQIIKPLLPGYKMLLQKKPLLWIANTLNVEEAYVKQIAVNVG